MELLIRSVQAVVGQRKTHQHGRDAEDLAEGIDHRKTPSHAQKDRLRAKAIAVGHRRRPHSRMITRHQRRTCIRACPHLTPHRGRSDPRNVPAKKPFNFVWVLVRGETKVKFG